MPDVVQFSNGNQIKNRYASDGRKLGTEYFTQLTTIQPLAEGTVLNQVYQANVVDQTGTANIGNFEYKTYWNVPLYTTLKKVFNTEGYVDEYNNNQPYSGYVYFRKDHLGNNREVWRAGKPGGNAATTIQRTWYYPGGLPWNYTTGTGASVQSYKYNSKEFIEMHGFDTYDYSARMMYPAIGGRFLSIDPLCEKYYSISPYAYCSGNPVNRIDPDGRANFWLNGKVVGNDGVNDQKIYAIKTTEKDFNGVAGAGLSRKDQKTTVDFIKANSGNAEAFKNNGFAYTNSIGIESSSDNRQAMVDIVTKDNGNGGTSAANNREYGGSIEKGKVVAATPGAVANPKTDATANILLPSGTKIPPTKVIIIRPNDIK